MGLEAAAGIQDLPFRKHAADCIEWSNPVGFAIFDDFVEMTQNRVVQIAQWRIIREASLRSLILRRGQPRKVACLDEGFMSRPDKFYVVP